MKIISVGNSRVKHHNSATERKTNFAKIQYIDTRDEVKLNNKIALITGGTSGIGLAVFRATPTGCWELSGAGSARRLDLWALRDMHAAAQHGFVQEQNYVGGGKLPLESGTAQPSL